MQQPTKDFLKDQLALAADEIIRLRAIVHVQRSVVEHYVAQDNDPWWRRWFR